MEISAIFRGNEMCRAVEVGCLAFCGWYSSREEKEDGYGWTEWVTRALF